MKAYLVGSKAPDQFEVLCRTSSGHLAAVGLGNLDSNATNAAGAAVDENVLSRLYFGDVDECIDGSTSGNSESSSFIETE